ncbi:MAG: DUF1622 domain-containing protein [Phycisphaerae bacterium]
MVEWTKQIAEHFASIIELLGLVVILVLVIHALGKALWHIRRDVPAQTMFRAARCRLVRGILLGLELLVAADIIRTVAIKLTFTSVGVLATIVVIRTFLSFVLEVEMNGRWPWQGEPETGEPGAECEL